jgi:hypothetical protein
MLDRARALDSGTLVNIGSTVDSKGAGGTRGKDDRRSRSTESTSEGLHVGTRSLVPEAGLAVAAAGTKDAVATAAGAGAAGATGAAPATAAVISAAVASFH